MPVLAQSLIEGRGIMNAGSGIFRLYMKKPATLVRQSHADRWCALMIVGALAAVIGLSMIDASA